MALQFAATSIRQLFGLGRIQKSFRSGTVYICQLWPCGPVGTEVSHVERFADLSRQNIGAGAPCQEIGVWKSSWDATGVVFVAVGVVGLCLLFCSAAEAPAKKHRQEKAKNATTARKHQQQNKHSYPLGTPLPDGLVWPSRSSRFAQFQAIRCWEMC